MSNVEPHPSLLGTGTKTETIHSSTSNRLHDHSQPKWCLITNWAKHFASIFCIFENFQVRTKFDCVVWHWPQCTLANSVVTSEPQAHTCYIWWLAIRWYSFDTRKSPKLTETFAPPKCRAVQAAASHCTGCWMTCCLSTHSSMLHSVHTFMYLS